MKKIVFIFLLVAGLFCTEDLFSQSGGRRREHKNQRRKTIRIFHKSSKSNGNADRFARGAGRSGFFKRVFYNNQAPAWVMHHKRESKSQRRENNFLFGRYRTKGKRYREGILAKQNNDRARRRVRGSAVFHKKKY